jgi:hypothetical protein
MDSRLKKLLDTPVALEQVLNKLDFTEEDILRAAMENPSLYLMAGTFRVQKMRKRMKAQHRLDLAQAEAGLRIRKIRTPDGKKKYTEPQIKEKIVLEDDVKENRQKLDGAFEEEEFSKLLLDSCRYRKDALRIIVDGRLSEAAGELREAKEGMVRSDMRKRSQQLRKKYERVVDSRNEED